jgi:hypothetical protein
VLNLGGRGFGKFRFCNPFLIFLPIILGGLFSAFWGRFLLRILKANSITLNYSFFLLDFWGSVFRDIASMIYTLV